MQITDIITYVMIAAAVAYFVVRDVRARKKGGCACGCGCSSGCPCGCSSGCPCGCNCKCCNCGCAKSCSCIYGKDNQN